MIKEIAKQIRAGKVIFFLGAGVSRNAPSNLPLSIEFNKVILRTLQEKMSISLSDEEINKLADIRLEVFFSQLNSLLKGDVYQIINGIKDADHNQLHHFIAELFRLGYTDAAITTNFDTLVENCVGEDICVFHHPDDYLKNQPGQSENFNYYKLHGSVDDDPERMKESIKVSLKQVGSPVQKAKQKFLRGFIRTKHIVFIGYSGLDDFDFYPILLNTPSRLSYYWVNHSISGTKITNRNIDALIKKRKKCLLIHADTKGFIQSLATELKITLPKLKKKSKTDPVEKIKEETRKLKIAAAPNYIIGKLFSFLHENEKTITFYTHSLKAKELDEAYILRDIGVTYVRLKLFDQAIEAFKKCLKIVVNTPVAAAHRLNIGYTYLEKYKLDKGEKEFLKLSEEFLLAALDTPDIDTADRSYALNNLCLVEIEKGQYDTALGLLNQSLKLKKQIGEVRAFGRGLTIKGEIYSLKRDRRRALHYFNKALEVQILLPDKEGVLATLHSKADHFSRFNNLSKAKAIEKDINAMQKK